MMTQVEPGRTIQKEQGEAIERAQQERGSKALIIIEDIDTDLIVSEIEGRVSKAWAYSFAQDGATVQGLTVAGIEQCSREAAKKGEALRVISKEHHWDAEARTWFVIVEMGRYAVPLDGGEAILLDSTLGTKQQPTRKYSKRKGRWYEVPNALDVAYSKATRNAKAKLLDPQLQERVLASALAGGRVHTPAPEQQQAAVHEAKREALQAPPGPEKIAEDQARATFYAAAKEMGLKTQTEMHERLRSVIGLACQGEHDVRTDNPNACHALREAVNRYAETTGPDKAAAWQYLTELLSAANEPSEEDVPFE